MDTLKGETVIAAGSSKGIGREIALALAENGADLMINGNNQEQLGHVKAQIEALGSRCRVVRKDISDSNTTARLAAACMEALGKIDILINNVGVNGRIPFLELTEEEWCRMMGISLDGVFYCCKAVLLHMVHRQSGVIINILSTVSRTAHANVSIYYRVSKAVVDSMAQKLAYEVGPHHIRVNGICPGPIETDMPLQWMEEYRKNVIKKIPLGLLRTTENVADVAVFLASDVAGLINGEMTNVNGRSYMD